MQIYHYDESGRYIGFGVADPDPMEQGNWLIPAKATNSAPPEAQEGYVRMFINGNWTQALIPADPEQEPSPDPTPEEIAQQTLLRFQAAHDAHLNNAARAKKYDSIHTAALRAGYPGPYQAEGLAFAQWMDACNQTGYQILAAVQAGEQETPESVEAYLAMLPVLTLPEE